MDKVARIVDDVTENKIKVSEVKDIVNDLTSYEKAKLLEALTELRRYSIIHEASVEEDLRCHIRKVMRNHDLEIFEDVEFTNPKSVYNSDPVTVSSHSFKSAQSELKNDGTVFNYLDKLGEINRTIKMCERFINKLRVPVGLKKSSIFS